MYKTLTLFLKKAKSRSNPLISKVAKGFLTKRLESTKLRPFLTGSKKTFAGEHKFEKISERGGSSNQRQGKFNLRNNMMSETIINFLNFVQENGSNMNDSDYNDACYILATKLENDIYKRINVVGLEKTIGFQQIKKFIQSNFDRLLTDNFAVQNLLYISTQLNLRSRALSIFTNEQSRKITDTVAANIENNHAKMSLGVLLNLITLVSSSRQINVNEILKNRSEEVSQLGIPSMNRFLKRVSNERVGDFVRENVSKLLIPEFLNLVSADKMINKCRAFNVVARLEESSPFNNLSRGKLSLLLKDIRSQAENHDQQTILLMIEGLVHYDDPARNPTLKEFYDIVTMTINHQPENIKVDFVLKFVENIVKIKSDNVLTAEHTKIILDYVVSAIQSQEEGKRLPMAVQFVPLFALMRKGKVFDQEIVKAITEHVKPFLARMNTDFRTFKFMIHKVIGDAYLEELENFVVSEVSKDFEAKPELNAIMCLSYLGKVGKFTNKNNPAAQKLIGDILSKIDQNLNNQANMILFINRYVEEVQENLSLSVKLQITEKITSRISTNDIANVRNPVDLMVSLSQLATTEEGTTRTKMTELINTISNDARFKKSLVPTLLRVAKDQFKTINNSVIYKFVTFIREAGKDLQFINETPRFFDKIITSCFYLCYNLDRDCNYTFDAISSLSNMADYLHIKHPDVQIDFSRAKIPAIIKIFEKAHINSVIINKAIPNFILNNREFERGYISSETIMILERFFSKPDSSENDLKEILNKHFPNEEKAQSYLNSTNSISTKIHLIKLFATINRKNFSVISDDYINKLKNYLIEDVIKGDQSELVKVQALFAFTNFKTQIINFNNESKEWSLLIKSVFSATPIKRLFSFVQSLPNNKNSKIIRKFLGEFAAIYEKEQITDKFFLLKIVNKFTNYGWTYSTFYNKVISDYEQVFDSFNSNDHVELINYFSKVDLNKEDVIRASLKNINIKILNESSRFELFNDLVKMGFISQEWKELILEKLLNSTDMTFAIQKANFRDRVYFLFNLWKLGNWPVNNSELVLFL
jgi:hypothetical protein